MVTTLLQPDIAPLEARRTAERNEYWPAPWVAWKSALPARLCEMVIHTGEAGVLAPVRRVGSQE